MSLKIRVTALAAAAATFAGAYAESYDYIIVGGGTAGSALATRLSLGLPSSSILLLEAGPSAPDELRINVPGMRGSALGSEYDWNFTSIPQASLGGREIPVNRGKVLGGSSALNYLCYDRASSAEYDSIGQLAGDEGTWNWETMLEAMLKSENFTGPTSEPAIHGTDGPIQNTFNRLVPDFLDTWKPTLNALGFPINDESLNGDPLGVMFQPTNVKTDSWTRSYAANSYIPEAGSNLVVMTNAHVARVEFTQCGTRHRQATGVVMADGVTYQARQEVILSAGSIGSPALLEMSGIGQKDVLTAAGIDVVLELDGVGENYQDHVRVGMAYTLPDNVTTFDPIIYDQDSAFTQEQFQLMLDGELSWFDMTTIAYAFSNLELVADPVTRQALVAMASAGADPHSVVDQKKLKWLTEDPSVPQFEFIMEANYVGVAGYPGGSTFTLIAALQHPMSRGSTHITSSDPLAKPAIDVNYFGNEYDLHAMIAGLKLMREMANTEPMKSLWETEYEPGPEVQTDAQWEAFIRESALTFFHPTGTCAMLPKRKGGVVDPELRVYGTDNLRVVDLSVMPLLVSAHPQTAVYGIAEIAAEMIIKDAKWWKNWS